MYSTTGVQNAHKDATCFTFFHMTERLIIWIPICSQNLYFCETPWLCNSGLFYVALCMGRRNNLYCTKSFTAWHLEVKKLWSFNSTTPTIRKSVIMVKQLFLFKKYGSWGKEKLLYIELLSNIRKVTVINHFCCIFLTAIFYLMQNTSRFWVNVLIKLQEKWCFLLC